MSQCQRVREHLESGRTLTGLQALDEYGCIHLASRISDLRAQGMRIATRRKTVVNRYGEKCSVAEYRLAE